MTTVLAVPEMSCGHCKSTVEGALTSVEGVDHARIDLDAKTVTIDHSDGVDGASLRQAVIDAGYTVTEGACRPPGVQPPSAIRATRP